MTAKSNIPPKGSQPVMTVRVFADAMNDTLRSHWSSKDSERVFVQSPDSVDGERVSVRVAVGALRDLYHEWLRQQPDKASIMQAEKE